MTSKKTWLALALVAATTVGVGCDDEETKPGGDGGAGVGGNKTDGGAVDAAAGAGGATGGTGGTKTDGGTDGPAAVTMALATLSPTSAAASGADAGSSALGGTIVFNQVGNTTTVIVNVSNATAGMRGLHIHAGGSCADTTADGGVVAAGAALGHWNPAMMKHGQLGADGGMHHSGDLGNITSSANGTGFKTVTTTEWKVSEVVGKTVILHAGPDDLVTDPTGNSGGRVACGVITAR